MEINYLALNQELNPVGGGTVWVTPPISSFLKGGLRGIWILQVWNFNQGTVRQAPSLGSRSRVVNFSPELILSIYEAAAYGR